MALGVPMLLTLILAAPPIGVWPKTVVAPQVEPHVREAFDAALQELPERLRIVHPTLRLERVEAHAVPVEAPLAHRLLGRAALMAFDHGTSTILVYDGAVRGAPTWGQPVPDAASLGAFLSDLAPTLGVPPGTTDADGAWDPEWLDESWCAFVGRVHRLDGSAPPEPSPPPGDPATLDRFLRSGVRVALGGLDPGDPNALVGLFVHELGHAIQFGCCADEHLRRWGELSQWRVRSLTRAPDDPMAERAAGRWGGLFRNEDPIVLVRLILRDRGDRGDRRRGVFFAPGCVRCFTTPYAEYDMAEDFAESVRLMAHDPATLATATPEKFLFVNAVGFNATLDHRDPGPLWRDVDEIAAADWRDPIVAALVALLDPDDIVSDGPRLDARTITSLLRAHAALLVADDLSPPHEWPAKPADLPSSIFDMAQRTDLAITIDGVEHIPPPSHIIDLWDRALVRQAELAEIDRLLAGFANSAESLRGQYEQTIAQQGNFAERLSRFRFLMPPLREHLEQAEFRELVQREVDHAISFESAAAAHLIAVESGLDAITLPGNVDRIDELTGSPHHRLELAVALARRAVRAGGDPIEWLETIPPTDPAGRGERVLLLREGWADGNPAVLAKLDEVADREAAEISWPRWRRHVLRVSALGSFRRDGD